MIVISGECLISVGDQIFFFVDFVFFHSKGWNEDEGRHRYFNG